PQDGVCSLQGRDLRRILWQEFQVRYARSSVYYLLHHQVGMRYLKPCPMHRKTDPAAQVAFKKSSLKRSKKSSSRMRTNALRYGSRMKVASGNRGR
ncbi:MAG: winged helix-turn-helix domain-containing protein, partial [Planctomycetes bacterium]|nr:winged helix-turn-helix domain-containing protein [Planctomycetota bacterium]